MDCREAILSDEYIDFVWKMDVRPPEAEWLPYGYCGQYISPNISVYYVRREEVFGNRISLPVGDYGVTYCHTQMDTESLEATRILTIQNQPGAAVKRERCDHWVRGFRDCPAKSRVPDFRWKNEADRTMGSDRSKRHCAGWISLWEQLWSGRDRFVASGRTGISAGTG